MTDRMAIFVMLILACQGAGMVLIHLLNRRLVDMEHRLATQYRVILEARAEVASMRLKEEARQKGGYLGGYRAPGPGGWDLINEANQKAMEQQEKMWKEAYKRPPGDPERREAYEPIPARDGYPTMPTGGM